MTVTEYRVKRRTVATLVEVGEVGPRLERGRREKAVSDMKGPDT